MKPTCSNSRKRPFHFVLAMLASCMCMPASAAVLVQGEVARIYPDDSGTIYFRLKNDTCNQGSAYYVIPSTEAMLTKWYALLLVTAETGAVVKLYLPDATSCGTSSHKPITHLYRDY